MSENSKKYYWIKLKTDFFDLPTMDWLADQENGYAYIVLYQKLCLLTANNGGELTRRIGEMIIPYNARKIAEVTRFDFDTVAVALELYKRLGLIYEQSNGILRLNGIREMVGAETKWAEKKRDQRRKKEIPLKAGQTEDNVLLLSEDNVREEYRDKRLEIRDKKLDTELEKENLPPLSNTLSSERLLERPPEGALPQKAAKRKFVPPKLEEVEDYCRERGNAVDASQFVDYYTSVGWKVGKQSMKDWKAAVRTWERRDGANLPQTKASRNDTVFQTSNPFMEILERECEKQ